MDIEKAGLETRSPWMRLRVTRRQLIAGAATIGAGLAVDGLAIEASRITVSRHKLGKPVDADSNHRPLRLVQLTDLHLRSLDRHAERVAEAVTSLAPDLLLLTGDSIDRHEYLPLLADFLELLDPNIPKFAILGNWEHWAGIDVGALGRVYEKHNGRLLCNESTVFTFGGRELLITGFDDLVGGRPDVSAAYSGVSAPPNHLLLAHCPMYRDVLGSLSRASSAVARHIDPRLLRPNYMLAGHTHGGQLNLLGWAPLRPQGCGRYVSGWYDNGPVSLYVSRGIGTSVVPARFGAPPEVACFEWHLAAD